MIHTLHTKQKKFRGGGGQTARCTQASCKKKDGYFFPNPMCLSVKVTFLTNRIRINRKGIRDVVKICNSGKVCKGPCYTMTQTYKEPVDGNFFFTSVAGACAGSTSFAEEPLRALFPCPWWAFASRLLSCWSLGCWSIRSLTRSTCSCDPAVVETRHRDLRIQPPRPRDLRRCRRRLRRQGGLHVCDGAWDEG